MAQTIILKNSNVAGKVPTAQDLALGELAVNVADGFMFFKRPNGEMAKIEPIGGLRETVNILDQRVDDLELQGKETRFVDSIAQLKEVKKGESKRAIITGYYAPKDTGGGSIYVLDETDTQSVDNGGTVIVANDGGRWKLVNNNVVSVRQFGAVGDGSTNDTVAFQKAVAYVFSSGNRSLYIPSGNYKVTGSLPIGTGFKNNSVFGDGVSSVISWTEGGDGLFVASGIVRGLTFRNFVVAKAGRQGSAPKYLFNFSHGNTDTDFVNVHCMYNTGDNTMIGGYYYVAPGALNDSINFVNCYMSVENKGVSLGAGSSVYFHGGRIISNHHNTLVNESTGIDITGEMGGVWIKSTDIIDATYGVRVRSANQVGSNREVFLVDTCIDSCSIGLQITDSGSYTNWSGVWASSCDSQNIEFNPSSNAATLTLTGGTVFNAGAIAIGTHFKYGVAVGRYGNFNCQGVIFRNNKGVGLIFTDGRRSATDSICEVIGNTFFGNGTAGVTNSCQVFLTGGVTFKDNRFKPNGSVPSMRADNATVNTCHMRGNVGLDVSNIHGITLPAIGASDQFVINQAGMWLQCYVSGGTGTQVKGIEFMQGEIIHNQTPGPLNCSFVLPPLGNFAVTYTSKPHFVVVPI